MMRRITGKNAIAISEKYGIPLRYAGEDVSTDEVPLGAMSSVYIEITDEQRGAIVRAELIERKLANHNPRHCRATWA